MNRHITLLLTAMTFALMGTQECVEPTQTRIMPLGDSITDGYNAPGGYRVDLYPQLTDGGVAVDFVGSLQNGPITLPDRDHEGHSGWRIDQIQDNVGTWIPAYDPALILLIIGTNDILQNYSVEDAPLRHDLLVGTLLELTPNGHVVVASIPPLTFSAELDARVQAFNAEIEGLAMHRADAGEAVSFVDIYPVLTAEDMFDGIHPNTTGYAKIADLFTDEVLRLEAL